MCTSVLAFIRGKCQGSRLWCPPFPGLSVLLAYKAVICGVNLYDFSLLEPDTGRFSQFNSLSFSKPFTWLVFAGLLSSSVGQEVKE